MSTALPEINTVDAKPVHDRASRTRQRILDATIESLIDDGYAATTTTKVQQIAGVSRGALMHHYPSKQDLLLSAVAHLARARGQWLTDKAQALPVGADRTGAVIGLLWSAMTGPLFAAATELWVASRTDEALRTALIDHERALGRGAGNVLADVLGIADPRDAAYREALDLVLLTFRGAALTMLLRDDARWERRVVAAATQTFRDLTNHLITLPESRTTR